MRSARGRRRLARLVSGLRQRTIPTALRAADSPMTSTVHCPSWLRRAPDLTAPRSLPRPCRRCRTAPNGCRPKGLLRHRVPPAQGPGHPSPRPAGARQWSQYAPSCLARHRSLNGRSQGNGGVGEAIAIVSAARWCALTEPRQERLRESGRRG